MKRTLTIIAFTIAIWGCGRSGSATNGAQTTPKTEPTPIVKAIDIPSLIDRSPDEVNKIVGVEGKLDNDGTYEGEHYHQTLRIELPQGGLFVQYQNHKQASIHFALQPVSDGSKSGFATAESFGQLVGIDLKGKTPASTNDEEVDYSDVDINGQKVHRIEVSRFAPGSFNRIDLYPHDSKR